MENSNSEIEPTVSPLRQAAHDLREAAENRIRSLSHHLDDVRDTASSRVAQAREIASERFSQFRDAASEKASAIRQRAGESWHDVKDNAKRLHETGETYVRENPTKTVLTALGIGIVIGLLIRR